ncbi:MAG TPA: cell division protein FtsH, partial [Rickettsia endosymbiont of Omalisus fontisbellaquei]|nr:cell division protein FtsH [Rickettsia endosymbiont of Omalisus fontisbellaquei]
AGRVAEEIIFGEDKVTSGASSDIKMATRMAKAMVTEWGLSDEVGPIFYGSNNEDLYARRSNDERSEKTSELIDFEVKKIITEGYNFAKNILTKHIDQLHVLANALVEYETLSGHQIKNLLSGKSLDSEEENTFPFGTSPVIKVDKAKTTKAKKENSSI